MKQSAGYRRDIDGLRAVAVMGVVLFHAKLGWIPGGFVGVDVFFVISGFLITRIIVSHEGTIGSFLLGFYERRIRRLVPPAIPVLIFTTACAWYLMPPAALIEFTQSLLAYSLFWSNWFFLSIAGYFDGPSHYKPLLHTWSLAIEEQFYLLFPIPILIIQRFGRHAVAILLGAVFVLSLGYSADLVSAGDLDNAFYNSFARFWEIAIGGLLAVGVVKVPKNAAVRQVLGIAGVGLILFSMIIYGNVPFPGLSALTPTVGAAMVILAVDSRANRFLSLRPVVAVGLISYALYLWHWPIFVFIGYGIIGASQWHYLAGAVLSIVLASISYWAVERPVRKGFILKHDRSLAGAFAAFFAVCIGAGTYVWAGSGMPNRFPYAAEYAVTLQQQLIEHRDKRLRSICWLSSDEDLQAAIRTCVHPVPGKHNVLLIGDSHAAHFFPALPEQWPDVEVDLLASDSCTLQHGDRRTCNDLTDWLDEKSTDGTLPYDRVIISVRVADIPLAEHLASLAETLVGRGLKVTLLGPIQYYQPDLPTLFPTMAGPTDRALMLQAFTEAVQPEQFEVDAFLRQRLAGSEVQYISLLHVTCPKGPKSCIHLDANGLPITLDASHLTIGAAKSIIQRIAPALILKSQPYQQR